MEAKSWPHEARTPPIKGVQMFSMSFAVIFATLGLLLLAVVLVLIAVFKS